MTKEEALKLSKIELELFEGDVEFKLQVEFQKLIAEALEKQIPKKPIPCNEVGTGVVCHCGQTLLKNWKPDFCMFCGQAIDWGETNEN